MAHRPDTLILLVAFDDMELLDLTGPAGIFAGANEALLRDGGQRFYDLVVAAPDGGAIRSSAGLTVVSDVALRAASELPVHTLVVAGGPGSGSITRDAGALAMIRDLAAKAERVASVCTGAFILAAAGLLGGKRATTHWAHVEEFRAAYPDVDLDPDPIWLRDGNVWTSAGVTAGMDLALALVEQDLGRALALEVARRRVMYLKRPGGQSQFSVHLAQQAASDGPIAKAQAIVATTYQRDLTVETLAADVGMSPRNFSRVFHRETGTTPGDYLEATRIDAARRWLEDSAVPVERVADLAGFGHRERMRRAFLKRLGVSPSGYRERFRGEAPDGDAFIAQRRSA